MKVTPVKCQGIVQKLDRIMLHKKGNIESEMLDTFCSTERKNKQPERENDSG